MNDLLALNEQEARANFPSCPPQLPVAYLGAKFDTELETIQLQRSSLLFFMDPILHISRSVQLELGSSL